jgi:stress-induced morphogen
VERQRRVHAVLADELKGPVHALSLTLLAVSEA